MGLVRDVDLVNLAGELLELFHTLVKGGLSAENGGVLLHDLLHLETEVGSGDGALLVEEVVVVRDGELTGVSGEGSVGSVGLDQRLNTVSASTAEDDNVEERVGTETVGAVDGGGSSLASSHEARNDSVGVVADLLHDLAMVVGGNTTHVVVHGGEHGDGLLGDVHAGENLGRLRDTRETLMENGGGKMVEVEVDVVLVGAHTATLVDFNGHSAGDDVTGGEILEAGGVALHEALTVGVLEIATLTAGTLGDEATSTVDARGVELDELEVLEGEASAGGHTATITSAGVGGGGREVGATITTCGDDGVVRLEAVPLTVLDVEGHYTTASTVLHDEVGGKVLNEEHAVVADGLTIEGVKHCVASTVSSGSTTVGLAAATEVERLTTEGTLVDSAVSGTGEGKTSSLELEDGVGSLLAHVVNGILVTEPVGTLDRVVGVPTPVVLGHVAEGSVDTTLGSDGVGTSGEELGNASSLVTLGSKTESSTKTSTTGTNNNSIVFVINDGVRLGRLLSSSRRSGRSSSSSVQ